MNGGRSGSHRACAVGGSYRVASAPALSRALPGRSPVWAPGSWFPHQSSSDERFGMSKVEGVCRCVAVVAAARCLNVGGCRTPVGPRRPGCVVALRVFSNSLGWGNAALSFFAGGGASSVGLKTARSRTSARSGGSPSSTFVALMDVCLRPACRKKVKRMMWTTSTTDNSPTCHAGPNGGLKSAFRLAHGQSCSPDVNSK